MKNHKRLWALVLALCMTLSVMPVGALATETVEEPTLSIGEAIAAPVEEVAEEAVTASGENVTAAALTMGTKPADSTTTNGFPFPLDIEGLNSYRIPALVTLSDGTLVAAADARWNTTYDGGGLDTIVSRSTDGGANWNYTFANYLGDNGNKYNGSGSTCFIDPALAVKKVDDTETIYMLVDLYPYGVALNGQPEVYPSTETGFNAAGKLLLSGDEHSNYDYYLDGKIIRDTDGNAVDGYTVDEYFNITTTATGAVSNLFFADSPFKVARTGYLYLTTSTDGGVSWSAPKLLNLKTTDPQERVCLVAPGRGLVTSTGMIVFPCYRYYATNVADPTTVEQNSGFIYSDDNGATWKRSTNFTGATWSSESAVVELEDGTLRFFYRNGSKTLMYVDYADGAWGTPQNTGIPTNSNCQISAISLQDTIGGDQVILVSCPDGPDSNGSNLSGASYRLNGRIHLFTVGTNNALTEVSSVAVPSKNSANSFMYSCLTAQTDKNGDETGTISILYEDNESAWGTGDSCYYQMSYAEYDVETAFDVTFDTDTGDDDDSGSTDDEEPDSDVVEITLKIGETSETFTDTTGNYEDTATIEDDTIAIMNVEGTTTAGSSTTNLVEATPETTEGWSGTYYISDGNGNFLTLNGSSLANTADRNAATTWTVKYHDTPSWGNGASRYHISSNGYYVNLKNGVFGVVTNSNDGNNYHYYRENVGFYGSSDGSNAWIYNNGWTVGTAGENSAKLYTLETVTTDAENKTEVTFTGKSVGTTTATVGSTTYKITVTSDANVENVELKVGESRTFTDYSGSYKDTYTGAGLDTGVANVTVTDLGGDNVTYTVSSTPATTLEDGETYIIAAHETVNDTKYALTTDSGSGAWGTTTRSMQAGLEAVTKKLWTLEADGDVNKFKINSASGYLNLGTGNNSATLNTTSGETFTFSYENGVWRFGNSSGKHLNLLGELRNYYSAGGYNVGSDFDLYKVTASKEVGTEIVIEAVGVGETSVVVGNTTYNITVTEDIEVILGIGETKEYIEASGDHTDTTEGPDASVVGMTLTKGTKKLTKVTTLDSGKQYLIVNTVTGDVLSREPKTVTGDWGDRYGLKTEEKASVDSQELWTITPVDGGGYTVAQDGYLTVGGYAAGTSETETTLFLSYTADGWTISNATTGGYYLSDNVGENYTDGALGTSVTTNTYRYWNIYEIEETECTNVKFEGLNPGASTVTIGYTTYHIIVKMEKISLEVEIGGTITADVDGTVTADDIAAFNAANGAMVTAALSDDGKTITFTGVKEGISEFYRLGNAKYSLKVIPAPVIGGSSKTSGEGEKITHLVINPNTSYDLNLLSKYADADATWSVEDTTYITIDENGTVTGVSPTMKDGAYFQTSLSVTIDGETWSIPVTVLDVPGTTSSKRTFDFYNREVVDCTSYYNYIYGIAGTDGTYTYTSTGMMAYPEGTKVYIQQDTTHTSLITFWGAPNEGYALAEMNADTGTYFHPVREQDSEGNFTYGTQGSIVAGNKYTWAYDQLVANAGNIEATNADAADELLNSAVEQGMDGMFFYSRGIQPDGDVDTHPAAGATFFVAEKLPEVSKGVNGILPNTKLWADWTLYRPGMYGEVGDYIFFQIDVTLEVPVAWQQENGADRVDENGLKYAVLLFDNAKLIDTLDGSYFYTKDMDYDENGALDAEIPENLKSNELDITDDLNRGWSQAEIAIGYRVHQYFVLYKIPDDNINSETITNHVDMEFDFASTYTDSSLSAECPAEVQINVLGKALGNYVIDFGKPLVISLTADEGAGKFNVANTNNAIGGAVYGGITFSDDQKTITYTPDAIMKGYDVVYLMDDANNLVNYFRVYPATTVYYEENIVDWGTDGKWTINGTAKDNAQTCIKLGESANDPYGYDVSYTDDGVGASNGTQATTSTIGAQGSFTFTGTGFDIYANCTTGSGYVAIQLQQVNADGTLTHKMLYMVDTVARSGDTSTTGNQDTNLYSLPIVSEQGLAYGTYKVTFTKVVDNKSVNIDGIRIYGAMKDSSIFKPDKEDNPEFHELRDYVLKAIGVSDTTDGKQMAEQVYNITAPDSAVILDATAPFTNQSATIKVKKEATTVDSITTYEDGSRRIDRVVNTVETHYDTNGNVLNVTKNQGSSILFYDPSGARVETEPTGTVKSKEEKTTVADPVEEEITVTTAQDMLENGPKNEVFLHKGESLVFKVKTSRVMQIGLKAPVGETKYTISYVEEGGNTVTGSETAISTSTDMFYALNNPIGTEKTYTVTISNKGDNILSVTDLKICDDPSFRFETLEPDDIEAALGGLGYGENDTEQDSGVTIGYAMQAFLTLEREVYLNVCFKLEGLEAGVKESSLNDRIGLLVWDADELPEQATVENCDQVYAAEWDETNGRFAARTAGIPAAQLGDSLAFRAYYVDDAGNYVYGRIVSGYSPKTYCYNQLKGDNTRDDALMVALLNYGAAAQKYFGYNTENLMNSDLTDEQKKINWDGSLVRTDWTVPEAKAGKLVRDESVVTARGAYLSLLGAIDYNYYVGVSGIEVKSVEMLYWTETEYAKLDVLTADNAEGTMKNYTWNSEKSRYEFTFEGLAAKDMFKSVYTCAVITDAKGNVYYSGVIAFCPERYVALTANSSNAAEAELARAMAIYGDAARTYFG